MSNQPKDAGIDEEFKNLFERTFEFHRELIMSMPRLIAKVQATPDIDALANLYYVAWHLEKYGAELKKKFNALDAFIARQLCTRWLNSNLMGEPIRTEYATFSPCAVDVPQLPSPKDEPERYAQCLRELGVSEEAIATGTVRINWPAFKEYKEKLDAEGLPLPDAFKGDQLPTFSCRVSHKKKEILE